MIPHLVGAPVLPIRYDRHRAAGNPTVGRPEWWIARSIQSIYPVPTRYGFILSDIPIRGDTPRMGRPPVGPPHSGGGIQFESIVSLPVLLSYHILVPTEGVTIQILPILSILFDHHPTGGESYGLDKHLAAYELAPKLNDRGALYCIPPRWYPAASNSIGPPRTPQ